MPSATPPPIPIRILFVEDSELDYEYLVAILTRDGFAISGLRVDEREAMQAALKSAPWDVVISDHNMPRFSSFEALSVLREHDKDLPFLVVSGESGEELAVETMLAGADDYIIKSRLKRLAPALRRSLQAANHRRERALAEQQLRVSETKLHELASHLELAKEEERAAIAREIHDDIGGTLTALKFDLAWLKRNTQLEGPVAARLAAAVKLAEEAALATQRMVRDLRPPVLNDGIAPALEWLTREFTQRSGIPLRFEVNREDIPIEEPTCIATYRICQEALTNVLKHARASKVDVSLFIAEDSLHLEVTDNGCGSTPADRAKSRSFGITSMRERARSLNGTLDISSPPGKGTTIMLSLPLPTISPNKETL